MIKFNSKIERRTLLTDPKLRLFLTFPKKKSIYMGPKSRLHPLPPSPPKTKVTFGIIYFLKELTFGIFFLTIY
jgi:hypothetical protein